MDIDTDFAKYIREDVVRYVAEKYAYKGDYPEEISGTTCNIFTESTLAARGAIRSIGRVLQIDKDLCDRVAKMIPSVPKIKIKDAFYAETTDEEGNTKKIETDLYKLYNSDETVKELIDNALLVEGLPDHTGVHAAGVIIADKPVSEYAAMFWNSEKECWAIQYGMVSCEEDLGLLKMDFLGLINLDILHLTKQYIKQNKNIDFNFMDINNADDLEVIADIYKGARTNGIFQFESGGMKQTLIDFEPKTIDDVAILNAAYRPGPMQYIPDITAVKHGIKKPFYIVPAMKDILEGTYGKPIYQEQIQMIFNKIAGFSLGQADIIRRAMSKKKFAVLASYQDQFFQGLKNAGAKDEDIKQFWEELLEFAKYAFNKSHACSYSVLSYYTAYFKKYFPTEFMASLLSYKPFTAYPMLIRECKDMGITVYTPSINASVAAFLPTAEGNIQYGLKYIKSVSASSHLIVEERKHGKYTDFKNTIARFALIGIKKNVIENLIKAGAFDCIIANRTAHLKVLEEYINSCKNCLKKIKNRKDAPQDRETLLEVLLEQWLPPIIDTSIEQNKREVLIDEKELIGFYSSGHPLEEFSKVIKENATEEIVFLDESCEDVTLAGEIKDFMLLSRKKDGKKMCKFVLEDLTGEIECICFTNAYQKFHKLIDNGVVAAISGKVEIETTENDDGEVVVLNKQMVVSDVRQINTCKLVILHTTIDVFAQKIEPVIQSCKGGTTKILLHDLDTGEMRKVKRTVYVDDELLSILKPYMEK